MTEIPHSVKVGPHTYKIVRKRGEMNQKRIDMAERDLVGQCDHAILQITVDPDLANGAQKDTLLHEVLHAVYNVVGAEGQKLAEEETIVRLTPTLLDTLQRNPGLVAYLTED